VIRLTCDGLDPLLLDDWDTGIVCEELDLGWPSIRAVAEDRPGGDGSIDTTAYHGARVVSVRLSVLDGATSRRTLLDRLHAFAHPARRPVMEFTDPSGGDLRAVTLRPADASGPLTNPTYTDVAMQWVAPDGVIVAAVARTTNLYPASAPEGWSPPLEPPLEFPEFIGGGPTPVANVGSAPAHWVARIFGPCSSPILTNLNSGQVVSLPGLAITSGNYIEVNSRERTVLLNGDSGASRYRFLDFAGSSWWTLAPGASFVTFAADSSAPPAMADLTWHDTYL
jgi:hypothetical protein